MNYERLVKLLERKYSAMMDLYRHDYIVGRTELAKDEVTCAMAYTEILTLLKDHEYFEEIYNLYFPAGD